MIENYRDYIWLDNIVEQRNSYLLLYRANIHGLLDISWLEQCLKVLTAKDPCFQCYYSSKDVCELFSNNVGSINLEIEDFKNKSKDELNFRIEHLLNHEFNINEPPLCRYILLEKNLNTYELILMFHHGVIDGIGLHRFVDELFKIYQKQSVAEHNTQTIKYSQQESDEKFWKSYLKSQYFDFTLPYLKKRSKHGGYYYFSINREIFELISEKYNISFFNIILSVYSAYLFRVFELEKFSILYPISMRLNNDNSFGCHINNLIQQFNISENDKFEQHLLDTQSERKKLKEHQNYPFFYLNKILRTNLQNPKKLDYRLALAETCLRNHSYKLQHITVESIPQVKNEVIYDLLLEYEIGNDSVNFRFNYNLSLFDDLSIAYFASAYEDYLLSSLNEPNLKISQHSLLNQIQKKSLIDLWYQQSSDSTNYSLVSGLEQSVKKFSNNIALIFNERTITYNELWYKASCSSQELQRRYHYNESCQGKPFVICVKDPIDRVISIISALMLGGFFVPLAEDIPEKRLLSILTDLDAKTIITDFYDSLEDDIETINIKDCFKAGNEYVHTNIVNQSIAYVIYTSGTTGMPKGVVMKHDAVVNTIVEVNQLFNIDETDIHFGLSSIGFDLSIYDVFGTLFTGGALVLIDNKVRYDIDSWLYLIRKHNITIWNSVPSLFNSLIEKLKYEKQVDKLNTLKIFLLSGDWIEPSKVAQAEKYFPTANFISLGGATEAGIWSNYYVMNKALDDYLKVPYGKALPNQSLYILNNNLEPVMPGKVGDIYISGLSLASGYLNNSDLTKNKFIYSDELNSYFYKTGDIGIYGFNNFHILGRKDQQIKINGFRIELGEIASILQSQPHIEKAYVLCDINKKILAYLSIKKEKEINLKRIVQQLREYLPSYMLPSKYFLIKTLPLNINGKIDLEKLRSNEYSEELTILNLPHKFEKNDVHEKLRKVFSDYLNLDKTDIKDDSNFYELGGDSIIAMQIASEASRVGIKLLAQDILTYKTMSNIYENLKHIDKKSSSIDASNKTTYPTPLQEELVAFKSYSPHSMAYYIVTSIEINDYLDEDKWKKSWLQCVYNESAFKQQFLNVNGDYVVKFIDNDGLEFHEFELNDESDFNLESARAKILAYNQSVPLTVFQYKLSDNKFYCLIKYHQIYLDGWAFNNLFTKVLSFYFNSALSREVDYSYKNYLLAWNETYQLIKKGSTIFWRSYLKDLTYPNEKFVDGSADQYLFDEEIIEFNNDKIRKIMEYLQPQGFTLNHAFQAMWALILAHITNNMDVLYGQVLAVRELQDTDYLNLIGACINTLPVRLKLDGSKTLIELLNIGKLDFQEKLAYVTTPLHEVHKSNNKTEKRDLFETVLIVENYPKFKTNKALNIGKIEFFEKTHFPISVFVNIEPIVSIKIVYNSTIKHEIINMIVKYMLKFIDAFLNNINLPLSSIYLFDKANSIKNENDFKSDINLHRSYLEYFSNQLTGYKKSIAVIQSGQKLSYEQLQHRINKIASALKANGINKGQVVLLQFSPSVEYLTLLLAVWSIGGIFCPLGLNTTPKRLKKFIVDIKPNLLISHKVDESLKKILPTITYKELVASTVSDAISISVNVDLQAPAYIIYTSGSTGIPKGVVISHNWILATLYYIGKYIKIDEKETFLPITNITFDISILEHLMPLLFGATLIFSEPDFLHDTRKLKALLDSEPINYMQSVPSRWQSLIDIGWQNKSNMKILSGGEAAPFSLVQALNKLGQCYNLYGPTEATIWTSINKFDLTDINNIGVPLPHIEYLVVDKFMHPVPEKIAGELLISSPGLSLGYYGDKDKTKNSFIEPDYLPGKRYFRTRDIVSIENSRKINFQGRVERQIKHNGHRIDLEEIENVIKEYSDISNVAVIQSKNQLESSLKAFILPSTTDIKKSRVNFGIFFFENMSMNHQYSEKNGYELYINAAKKADELGFSAVWTPERHFSEVGGNYSSPSVLSAAVAMVTQQISIRAGSIVLPLHNPIRVAEEWSIIDRLSNGRVGIAFASGWNKIDFYLAEDSFDDRKKSLREKISEFKQCWNNELYPNNSIESKIDQSNTVTTYPRPITKYIPIWITAAGNEETFVYAGEIGANLITHFLEQDYSDLEKKINLYKNSLTRNGYDPSNKVITIMLHTYLAETKEEAVEKSRPLLYKYLEKHFNLIKSLVDVGQGIQLNNENVHEYIHNALDKLLAHSLIGDVKSCQSLVVKLAEIGVTEIACLIDFGIEPSDCLDSLFHLNKVRLNSEEINVSSQKEIDLDELQEYVSKNLPMHMLPNDYAIIKEMPLNLSGKIDYKYLEKNYNKFSYKSSFVTKFDLIDDVMSNIWTSVLKHDDFDNNTSFFTVGGQSLKAVQVLSRINSYFNKNISLVSFFKYPTISGLKNLVQDEFNMCSKRLILSPHRNIGELSYEQEEMWGAYYLNKTSPRYNDVLTFRIEGKLNLELLSQSITELTKKHSILRTKFVEENGKTKQVIEQFSNDCLELINIEDNCAHNINKIMLELSIIPFNLETEYAWKVYLIHAHDDNSFYFLIKIHHIITDGWTMSLILRELSNYYNDTNNISEIPEKTTRFEYIDYAYNDKKIKDRKNINCYIKYLKLTTKSFDSDFIQIPTDYTRKNVQEFEGEYYKFSLPSQLIYDINNYVRKNDITLFSLLFTVYNFQLYLYTDKKTFLAVTPTSNRRFSALEDMLGNFVNTTVVRFDFNMSERIVDLIKNTLADMVHIYTNNYVPFKLLISQLGMGRDLSQNAIINNSFVMHNNPDINLELNNLVVTKNEINIPFARADFILGCHSNDFSESINFYIEYDTELFEKSSIFLFSNRYIDLLQKIVAEPEVLADELSLLSDKENKVFLENKFHQLTNPVLTIGEQFQSIAKQYNNKICLIHNDANISYGDLYRKSMELSDKFKNLGIKEGSRVIIKLPRSVEAISSMLGVLFLGAIYIPLEYELPEARLNNIIESCKIDSIIQLENDENLTGSIVKIIALNNILDEISKDCKDKKIMVAIPYTSAAYITYTSGTSGEPKAIMISHASLLNLVNNNSEINFESNEIFCHISSLAFDASAMEIWGALLNGATLVIIDNENVLDLNSFSRIISKHRVTSAILITSLFNKIVEEEPEILSSLYKVYFAGELCNFELVRRLFHLNLNPQYLYHAYGPAEATILTTLYLVTKDTLRYKEIPIGKPIDNVLVYVLNSDKKLVAKNIAGELYIGGKSLTIGYANRFKGNDETFIPNPWGEGQLYRTGDIVKWNDDYELIYLYRKDSQIKIRGYRVDPVEIEQVLSSNPDISNVAIIVGTKENNADKMLIAYFTLNKETLLKNESKLLSRWNDFYNHFYADNDFVKKNQLLATGWNSRLEKIPFSNEEIDDWLCDVKDLLVKYNTNSILEIGCGHGLLTEKLAKYVENYVGIDISSSAIDIAKAHNINSIESLKFYQLGALDIDKLNKNNFSIAILNSVIQYFPSLSYLTNVINSCVNKLNDDGIVFIGDVRSLELSEYYYQKIIENKDENNKNHDELFALERELLISPLYFVGLRKYSGIKVAAKVLRKKSLIPNELNIFRYDVILLQETNHHCSNMVINYNDFNVSNVSLDVDVLIIKNVIDDIAYKFCGVQYSSKYVISDLIRELDRKNIEYDIVLSSVMWSYTVYIYPNGYINNFIMDEFDEKSSLPYLSNFPINTCVNLGKYRNYLDKLLPNYMIPDKFILLEKIPMTSSGKIDRNSLTDVKPILRKKGSQQKVKYISILESALYEIWQEVLNLDSFSVNDNFFELGGDSINIISVIAKAKKKEIIINPKVMYKYQTIRTLSKYLEENGAKIISASQSEFKSDSIPLSPTQHWFFDVAKVQNINHWNQAFLLDINFAITVDDLKNSIDTIVSQHEIFDLRGVFKDKYFEQQYVHDKNTYAIDKITLEDYDESVIIEICNKNQEKLNVESGPIMKVILFNVDKKQKLFIAMHHFVIDGVSWRIFLEDLFFLVEYRKIGKKYDYPKPVSTYLDYISELYRYSNSESIMKEINYWKSIKASPLFIELEDKKCLNKDIQFIGRVLSREKTKHITTQLVKKYNTSINAVLLTALLYSFKQLNNGNDLYLDMETHGRQLFANDIDLSRTIGWFTSIFPITLHSNSISVTKILKDISSQLEQLPNNGFGFGVLKYLSSETLIRDHFSNMPKPELNFNYFGKLDMPVKDFSPFSYASEHISNYRDPDSECIYNIEFGSHISDNIFHLYINFNPKVYSKETIQKLCDYYFEAIEKMSFPIEYEVPAIKQDKTFLKCFHQQATKKHTVIFLPPLGGKLYWYNHLIDELRDSCNIYGFQEYYDDSHKINSIVDRINIYKAELANNKITPPLVIVGWSFGCEVAFELTKQYSDNQKVQLILLDPQEISVNSSQELIQKIIYDLNLRYKLSITCDFGNLDNNSLIDALSFFNQYYLLSDESLKDEQARKHITMAITNYVDNLKSILEYIPTGAVNNIAVVRAEILENDELSITQSTKLNKWEKFTRKDYKLYNMYCTHYEMMSKSNSSIILDIIKSKLKELNS